MPETHSVTCTITKEGVLVPSQQNSIVDVIVEKEKSVGGTSSGKIIWNNKIQAFIIYDPTGSKVVSFTITDMGLSSHITEQSVRNIINEI